MSKILRVKISRIQYADLYIEVDENLEDYKQLRKDRRFIEKAATETLNEEDWAADEDQLDLQVESIDSSCDYTENLEDGRIVKYEQ